tara:strand:+ start:153 stop:353 length:201 start_codon:yes stop_codon:yes gene_type:complete
MCILGNDKMLEIAASTAFTFFLETVFNKVGEKLMENIGGEETNHVNHEVKEELPEHIRMRRRRRRG